MSTSLFDDGAGHQDEGIPEPRISLIWIQTTNWSRMLPVPGRLQEPAGWVMDRVKHIVARVNAKYRFRRAQHVGRVYAYGAIAVENSGEMTIGENVLFQAGPYRSRIRCSPGARVVIADAAHFNYGFLIEAHHRVEIGERCEVSTRCMLVDETAQRSGPITLEPDVWLAHGVIVMPGVRIGKGSVISAGTIVDVDVPAGSMVIGRPGRHIALRTVAR